MRVVTRKKLATAALAGLLSAGALTAGGEAARAQSQGEGEVVNREVQVTEDRDYTGLWGLLGLLGLAGLAGLRRKKGDDSVDVRRSPSTSANGDARRGDGVRDSEAVSGTDGKNGGGRVNVERDVAGGTDARRTPRR